VLYDPWAHQGDIGAVQVLPSGAERREAWRKLNMEIGRKNRAAIDGCNAMFAVLTATDATGQRPFRPFQIFH
jgi:hypothetical protein